MKLLEVKNYCFTYKNSSRRVLSNVSFEAYEGELILVCGATACGKTTLLRGLKPELSPVGEKSGEIIYCGNPLSEADERTTAAEIGYVMQRPENQTVTDRVRSELSFGGESLGMPQAEIQRSVAETAAYFGLERLLSESTSTLSGGQRQLLNLASVMAVSPKLIILDEPTAQLDPVAAGDFIRTLYRITRELSVTVIISEHRFEELLPLADKVLFLENGEVSSFGTPKEAAERLMESKEMRPSLPAGLQLYSSFGKDSLKGELPLTISEGRRLLAENFTFPDEKNDNETAQSEASIETEISLKNLYFTYNSRKADVVSGLSLDIKSGEVFALLGSNGSGKSTLLSLICGMEKPYRGKVELAGKALKKYGREELYGKILAVLPQDVQSTFLYDSVGEELEFTEDKSIYDFTALYDTHPYDLSGGQQQLLGIKKLLSSEPRIILLDEPTKGLDGSFRDRIAEIITELKHQGRTILLVTHDTELAAAVSDRCGIFFDGTVTSVSTPYKLMSRSMYYTTNAAKTARGICGGAITSQQLISRCTQAERRGSVK